ncbi:MAG: hypothetical protein V3U60_16645 [Gammaproteobacteria bacterium]
MSMERANCEIVEWAKSNGMFKRAANPILRVLALGAGIQSTTVALMAAHGEIGPMPDGAIFADTGWEPRAVYEHLKWLSSGNVLPFPVYVVNNGNIRDMLTSTENGRFHSVPFFLKHPDGNRGMSRRQCTHEMKLKPINWEIRRLLGKGRKDRIAKHAVEVWIGISTDEAGRMKPARQQWQLTRWPLIEAGMSRRDCMKWLAKFAYEIPSKSSCIGCPFHNDAMWRDMKANDPESWTDAVAVDRIIRQGGTTQSQALRGEQYMHTSLKPLDEVDLSTAEDRGQLNFFINECEGMCGV